METEWGSKLFSIMKWVWAPQRKNCVFVIGKLSFFKIMQDIKTFLEKNYWQMILRIQVLQVYNY